jgi:lipopolysaccharide transport system ATP-binding protein
MPDLSLAKVENVPLKPDRKTEIAVRVQNLGKAYRIYDRPQDRLKLMLFRRFGKSYGREFWALRDVSFEVPRGRALGIIGRNGSGKSTLLQLIAGTLGPSLGTVELHGRVAALLELGSGFNPEFTGIENIYLNGTILGFSRSAIEEKLDDILAFADIGPFIYQPVKTYSSGMVVRVAFAVHQALEPDILIVDEALAVGDVFFQQKCFNRIRQIINRGTTLLLVSHDTAAIQNICDSGILLHKGSLAFMGPPEECVSRYFSIEGAQRVKGGADVEAASKSAQISAHARAEILQYNVLSSARSRIGNQELELLAATYENEKGEHSFSTEMMKRATINMLLHARAPIASPGCGLNLYDRMSNLIFAAGTRQLRFPMTPMCAGEERIVRFQIRLSIQPGEYTFSLGCGEPSLRGPDFGFLHDRHEGLGPISVHYEGAGAMPFYGIAHLPISISVDEIERDSS